MKIEGLNKLQAEILQLGKAIAEKNETFFRGLSGYDSLKECLEIETGMASDEDRADFLCILIKDRFLTLKGLPAFIKISSDNQVIKTSRTLRALGHTWDIRVEFDTYEKKVSLDAHMFNYDSIRVRYEFDCLDLARLVLISEETDGKTKTTEYQGTHHKDLEDERRNDNDIRKIIDFIFDCLKNHPEIITYANK